MAFSAIYDACVLYPFQVRDALMVAALTREFAVYWTDAILDECTRNLIKDRRATEENMRKLVADMKKVFPHATIPLADYEGLIQVMTNHPKDRHVLAAAVARRIDVVVTINMDDFPATSLESYSIEAQTPDEFVRHVLDLAPDIYVARFRDRNDARRAWAIKNNKPPNSDVEIAEQLALTAHPKMPETSKYLIELLNR